MTNDYEEILAAVDAAVAELLAAAGVTEPPVDAVALARHLAIDPDSGRRPRRAGRAAEGEPTEEQRQWAAARAVADRLRPELLAKLGVEGLVGLAGASLSNLLAARLLTPDDWFAHDCRDCDFDLEALKQRYRTAARETIAWRWLDLPEPCIVAVVTGDRPQRRRANAGRAPAGLSPAEQRCAATVQETGQPQQVRIGGWSVHGWPLGPDRTVLRSTLDEGVI